MKRILVSLLALSLFASGSALADPHHKKHGHGHGNGHAHGHHDQHGHPGGHKFKHKRGDRLAASHRGHHVHDFHVHGLAPPPHGHEWRRIDGEYVLIAVATGVIASVIAAQL